MENDSEYKRLLMEGVRRIIIFGDDEQIYRIRAPVMFKDFKIAIQKLGISVSYSVKFMYQKRKVSVYNQQTYSKSLKNCGFEGLSIKVNNTNVIPSTNSISTSNPLKNDKQGKFLPSKRQRSNSPLSLAPKPPQKKPSTLKPSPSINSKHSEQSLTSKYSNPSKNSTKPKLSSNLTPTLKKSSQIATSFLYPTTKTPTQFFFSPLSNSSSTTPTISSQFTTQPDIDIQNAMFIIKSDEVITIIDPTTETFQLKPIKNIKTSSRLLLTPEGILVTGGKNDPCQVLLINPDYSATPLASMNGPRFFHCMGYIDGYPAVVAGSETEIIPRIVLDSVEIYKNGVWVDYPKLNIRRASPCMCWNSKSAYIIGGVLTTESFNSRTDQIEKFQDGKWVLLNIRLPIKLLYCGGFVVSENKLVVFGGETDKGELSDKQFSLNLMDGTIEKNQFIPFAAKFTCGQQANLFSSQILICDSLGRVLKLKV